jgi:hypothetical protein
MTEAVFQFKAIARKLNRQEQKAEFEEKNRPIPDTSMYGWPYGLASPVVAVTMCEGGDWIPVEQAREGDLAHSVKFADGSVWDEINGWRSAKI